MGRPQNRQDQDRQAPGQEHQGRQPQLPMGLDPAPAQPSAKAAGRAGGDWRIDARTRRAGLRGVAQARAALAASRRARGDDGQPDAA